jgi:protocatechuate 3,4-dioxygenase alpha subunit
VEDVKPTPSQTVGPYYGMRLARPGENVVTAGGEGASIRVVGRVMDGDGAPIEDALVEIWQANSAGRYQHPADSRAEVPLDAGFTGFGRATTSLVERDFWFETVKPGRVPAPDGSLQAPHLSLVVQARGMLRPVFTRLYFDDEARANAEDFVLTRVPELRRRTLVATSVSVDGRLVYRFDVRFQGPDETVFFAFEE